MDLLGSMAELVLDVLGSGYPKVCDNCADVGNSDFERHRVVKGAGWENYVPYETAQSVEPLSMSARSSNHGFRCARTP